MADNPSSGPTPPRSSYWYDGEAAVVEMLAALRAFRRADQEMRRRMSADMDMNVTDMQALQFIIAAEGQGRTVAPRDLAAHLRISTASTTKLLDRLTASGHLERTPHPTDRRSLIVVPTEHAHREVRDRLARMHERMREIARAVPEPARPAVVTFLRDMARELDEAGSPAPLTPRPPTSGS
ncbi:DNA-binding MarR family transcriptional regulator [Georgenia soli]|uniref:DNA-binding MarR family transcriptional regulator n=1 Tax=Georgenia soli TaxID=638953 RepID=A0A2A9EJ72_9MICO|nr:MarR family winged helix-turn-helix transcriptional regulator [Georgenia soli]PFG39127.1 DNA-binding MarR family transcriptional regulator [Georgenia soli]